MGAIVLSMILTVVAFAGYRVYEREMPTKFMARRLTSTFSMARASAIAHNSTFTVKIDRKHENFWLDETTAGGAILVPKVTSPEQFDEKVEIKSIIFGQNSATTAEVTHIHFYADGSSDDVNLALILKGQSGANTYTVRLYGPTGLSRVIPPGGQ